MFRAAALLFVGLALAPLPFAFSSRDEAPEKEAWIQLFNGKNLEGWTPKVKGFEAGVNHLDTFRVEDGLLKVRYDKYEKFDSRFGHLFHKDKFSKYRLRIEYRFVDKQCPGGPGWAIRNSGVMIHCQSPQSMRIEQDFPVSIEVQFLGGDGKNARPTGNLCTPGTNVVLGGKLFTPHCVNLKSETIHGEQWVTVEAEVHGDKTIRHLVNGKVAIEYEQPQLDPKDADAKKLIQGDKLLIQEGYIALQSESHPIDFRKVEVMLLKE